MKNIFANRISFLPAILLALTIITSSCEKDTDGSPENKPGTPVLKSVVPAEGAGGVLVTITGTGLGDMRSAIFEKSSVPASLMSTLNTSTHILFRVPSDAIGGNQNIILTNSEGKTLTVPFKVIALPVVTAVFPTDFEAGSTVTLTGNNLDDVSEVLIDGTTDAATIVSQTKKSLVITMPASNVDNGSLKITNLSGFIVTTQKFINIDKALCVFKDALVNGFESWSWGGTYTPSTDDFITGTSSMKAVFDAGGWGGMQLGNNGSINIAGYKYFAFWAKGADVDYDVQVNLNWAGWKSFTIPAGKWTYFKYELATTPEWAGLTTINNVTYQIKGSDKTFYFDNIVFIK